MINEIINNVPAELFTVCVCDFKQGLWMYVPNGGHPQKIVLHLIL